MNQANSNTVALLQRRLPLPTLPHTNNKLLNHSTLSHHALTRTTSAALVPSRLPSASVRHRQIGVSVPPPPQPPPPQDIDAPRKRMRTEGLPLAEKGPFALTANTTTKPTNYKGCKFYFDYMSNAVKTSLRSMVIELKGSVAEFMDKTCTHIVSGDCTNALRAMARNLDAHLWTVKQFQLNTRAIFEHNAKGLTSIRGIMTQRKSNIPFSLPHPVQAPMTLPENYISLRGTYHLLIDEYSQRHQAITVKTWCKKNELTRDIVDSWPRMYFPSARRLRRLARRKNPRRRIHGSLFVQWESSSEEDDDDDDGDDEEDEDGKRGNGGGGGGRCAVERGASRTGGENDKGGGDGHNHGCGVEPGVHPVDTGGGHKDFGPITEAVGAAVSVESTTAGVAPAPYPITMGGCSGHTGETTKVAELSALQASGYGTSTVPRAPPMLLGDSVKSLLRRATGVGKPITGSIDATTTVAIKESVGGHGVGLSAIPTRLTRGGGVNNFVETVAKQQRMVVSTTMQRSMRHRQAVDTESGDKEDAMEKMRHDVDDMDHDMDDEVDESDSDEDEAIMTVAKRTVLAYRYRAGFCENCHEKFDEYEKHIKSKRHREWATDPRNFYELDKLAQSVNRVLLKDHLAAKQVAVDTKMNLEQEKERVYRKRLEQWRVEREDQLTQQWQQQQSQRHQRLVSKEVDLPGTESVCVDNKASNVTKHAVQSENKTFRDTSPTSSIKVSDVKTSRISTASLIPVNECIMTHLSSAVVEALLDSTKFYEAWDVGMDGVLKGITAEAQFGHVHHQSM